MAKLVMRVDIEAPLPDVFDFVADYRNALLFMDSFHSFRPLTTHTYGPRAKVLAGGRLRGIPISAELEIIGFERNRRLVSSSRLGISSTSEWLFEDCEAGTRVTFAAEYRLPNLPLAGKIIGKLMDDEIRAATRRTLENLKRVMEGRSNGLPDPAKD